VGGCCHGGVFGGGTDGAMNGGSGGGIIDGVDWLTAYTQHKNIWFNRQSIDQLLTLPIWLTIPQGLHPVSWMTGLVYSV